MIAPPDAIRALSPVTAVLVVLTFILLILPMAAMAFVLAIGLLPLPYELAMVLRRLPWIFPLHMIAAALALIFMPIAAFARRWRGVHRVLGRVAAAAVVVGGLTALPVALASEAGSLARAGFFVQGIVWLALLGAAVTAIRRGAAARHARLMLAMAAVASGAIWVRITISAATRAGLPFDQVYAAAAWGCWMLPLALTMLATARREPRIQKVERRPSGRLSVA